MTKLRVGILGATGMVGQRFVTLLSHHPWFHITSLAASPRSAGRAYHDAVGGRWAMPAPIPANVHSLPVRAVEADLKAIAADVDLVFCALDMDKEAIKQIEIDYAAAGVAVVSNNSAHRWTDDVPMLMPEVNLDHLKLIDTQRRRRGWSTGLIAVKPNCSIQSYVAILTALAQYEPTQVSVTSLQAISGAGKTFDTWPEMVDNVIPLIGGEEDKSEREPLKIWGSLNNDQLKLATTPTISATCIRVPVSDGHLANVSVNFKHKPTREQIIKAVQAYPGLDLPSAPKQFIRYLDEPDRPQTRLDRDAEHGMGITMGRLREDTLFDYSFIALSHNTLRGAAGGAVLMAEALVDKGYIKT
ncbi:MAG: aspartate-semialdehyde dehydrogenase [Candidatus Saccharibacteria bacterium]|nr:aspartate-semialdehyde dehydrogenase [Candidatus Saccharibacteria bacterium]